MSPSRLLLRLLVAALVLASLSAQTIPNICPIESPPEEPACRGDPINMLSGFTYHPAIDVELETGADQFVLQRYFLPIGAQGGSKSPLYSILGQGWPDAGPPSPFGQDANEERPVWSNVTVRRSTC